MPHCPDREDITGIAYEAFRARHGAVGTAGDLVAGPPVPVKRFDRAGGYLLIPIRDAAGLRGIVQVDADSRVVEASADIRDPSTRFLASSAAALDAARKVLVDTRGWQEPFLAWRPCRESMDSMRPLWVVPHAEGQAFVTQDLRVFAALTEGLGG